MALRQHKEKRIKGLIWKSGNFYTFKYKGWENDPKPTIIFMYAYSGHHPTTNREWRFFQGVNFSYIPRNVRKRFMATYLEARSKNTDMKFVWDSVKTKYPWLKIAVRRYFYSPSTFIVTPKEIPFEDAERLVVSTWQKDFSKKTITAIRSKFRFGKKKKTRKKKVLSEKRFKSLRNWTQNDTPRQHGL